MDKLAVSTALALSTLRARMGQGARVAPGVLEQAAHLPAPAAAPAALRQLTLNAGVDARAAARTRALAQHPIPAARRRAAEQVSELEVTQPARMFDLENGYGKHLELPFASQQKKDMLFGGGGALQDPRGLMRAAPPPPLAVAHTAINPLGATVSFRRKAAAAHKLHARVKFRDLPISIETPKSGYRHWTDAATGEKGKTKMRYPYGYIRRTQGLDGDHVDVFIGPNQNATHVYVVMTNKAPDFKSPDEEKCMLGFDAIEEAEAAFRVHYDKPGFFRSIKALPFATFRERVFETFDGTRRKVGYEVMPDIGIEEKPRGYPPTGGSRKVLGDPMSPSQRLSREFDYLDLFQDRGAVDDVWAPPSGAPLL